MSIKAIETQYAGCKFRSRLEARWAVFFDYLNIPWEYEKEGYELSDGTWYLPDFWLPTSELFIEVKGTEPTHEEKQKATLLSVGTQKVVAIASGTPTLEPFPHDPSLYCQVPPFSIFAFAGEAEAIWPIQPHQLFGQYEFIFEDLQEWLIEKGYLGSSPEGIDSIHRRREIVEADRRYYLDENGGEHPTWQYGRTCKWASLRLEGRKLILGEFESDEAVFLASNAAREARF